MTEISMCALEHEAQRWCLSSNRVRHHHRYDHHPLQIELVECGCLGGIFFLGCRLRLPESRQLLSTVVKRNNIQHTFQPRQIGICCV